MLPSTLCRSSLLSANFSCCRKVPDEDSVTEYRPQLILQLERDSRACKANPTLSVERHAVVIRLGHWVASAVPYVFSVPWIMIVLTLDSGYDIDLAPCPSWGVPFGSS